MRYDAIIIGSGVSGLTAAIILAQEGRRVLVVEQHSRAGGLMQHFRRGPFLFPTGVHRLGSLDPGQILWRYFAYLGVLDRLALNRLDPEGFEEYCFPGLTFRVPQGLEAFQERLHRHFPGEKRQIDSFCRDLRQTVSQFALYNLTGRPPGLPQLWDDSRSLAAYLDDLGCSRELQAVLSANNPLYGIPPDQCPLPTHFLVFDSFLQSSWRVDEYLTPLAEAFRQSLMDKGGEVRCGARVTAIPTASQQTLGVTLAGGEFLEGGLVIFTGHPRHLLDLCLPEAFRPAFRNRLLEARDTIGAFSLALAWNHPDCVLAQRDAILYNSWDTGAPYRQKLVGTDATPGMVFVSAASRPTAEGYAVVALIGMKPEDMEPFEETRRGNRSEAYRAAKASVAERLVNILKARWPQQTQGLRIMDTATPLTFRDYTLAPRGTAYGIIKGAGNFRHSQFSAETRVKNLFLAGQSIIQPGVLGALISGVHVAGVILGREYLVERIIKATL